MGFIVKACPEFVEGMKVEAGRMWEGMKKAERGRRVKRRKWGKRL